jgi:hypothetical protein
MAEQRGVRTINIHLIYLQVYKWVNSVAVWSHIKKIIDQCSGYNFHQWISHCVIKDDSYWWPIDFYSTAELTDHLKFVLLICQSQLVFILILVPIDQISRMWLVWIYGVAPFSTIFQFISWSVSLMDETEILGENHLWQVTDEFYHIMLHHVHLTMNRARTHNVSGDRHRLHR